MSELIEIPIIGGFVAKSEIAAIRKLDHSKCDVTNTDTLPRIVIDTHKGGVGAFIVESDSIEGRDWVYAEIRKQLRPSAFKALSDWVRMMTDRIQHSASRGLKIGR